jgi:DNA primase
MTSDQNSVMTSKQKGLLDLVAVKEIIFSDIELLLDSFGLEYKQDGDNIFMKCPVHAGSDNEHGVSISISKRLWTCWTRGCHKDHNSDIFGFIKGVLGTDKFGDVLKYIRKLYNLDAARQFNAPTKSLTVDQDFSSLVKTFSAFKPDVLKHAFEMPPTTLTSPYFESRGFDPSTLSHFGVADCNDTQHVMRHRAIIPVRYCATTVGFIARSTQEWLHPKYLFSSGFKKSHYFYNYDDGMTHANDLGCLFLVEGQGDVWRLWEAGCKNVVGLFGKSISSHQKHMLLQSGITALLVLTDNDQAGREAKMKIKRDLGRFFDLIFPAMHSHDIGSSSKQKVQDSILSKLERYYLK